MVDIFINSPLEGYLHAIIPDVQVVYIYPTAALKGHLEADIPYIQVVYISKEESLKGHLEALVPDVAIVQLNVAEVLSGHLEVTLEDPDDPDIVDLAISDVLSGHLTVNISTVVIRHLSVTEALRGHLEAHIPLPVQPFLNVYGFLPIMMVGSVGADTDTGITYWGPASTIEANTVVDGDPTGVDLDIEAVITARTSVTATPEFGGTVFVAMYPKAEFKSNIGGI